MSKLQFSTMATLASLISVAAPASAEPTYAERLGWGANDRVVIFHSDDAGMSHGTNTGTVQSYEDGLVSSVSVMMPCPWVPEIVDYVKANKGADFGLHLTMTSEWDHYRWGPVAGRPAVPGLVDEEGALWDNVPLVIANASPDEVEREIRAQIERAERMGFEFTHMDSHMGTLFADARYFERYVKVGIEKQIPILIAGGHMTYSRIENGPAVALLGEAAVAVWDGGLPVLDDVHTASYGWKDEAEKLENYIQLMSDLKPGVTEVIMHCVHVTDVLPVITSSVSVRRGDFQAMMSPRLRKAVEDEGIILTTWRELMERRRAVGSGN